MKNNIHLWQIEVIAWQPEKNLRKMKEVISKTPENDFIIFPEMAIPGYMVGDMWLRDSFVKECNSMNDEILDSLKKSNNSAIWWNVGYDINKKNEDWTMRKYNSAFVWEKWALLGVRYKTLLPNYRMFDDKRYFTSLQTLALEEWKPIEDYYEPFIMEINSIKRRVWVLICEDIWNINWDYRLDPVALTKMYNIELLWVISASPFGLNKDIFRKKLLKTHSEGIELAYVNPIWTQNNGKNIFTFDWGSALYKNWNQVKWVINFTENKINGIVKCKSEIEQIFETLVYSIKKFFEKSGFKKALIWLSWWIDSWVVASLLTLALGKENVVAINMPSKFNTDATKDLAFNLAQNLGIEYKIFPIQESVDLKIRQITDLTGKTPTNFEIENIQARERWQILADLGANLWALFTNNWNKDEFATWYATLYGDVCWAVAPIGDLHKTQVFELARFINEKFGKIVIPTKMIEMKPTAELSEEQNPENNWWDPFDYEFLGKLNRSFLEKKYIPADIIDFYDVWILNEKIWLEKDVNEIFDNREAFVNEVNKIWKLLQNSYFKRIQAPPIITISKASFGFDYREAIVG